MSRRFVVVATGQGVANLPPVLELARPGDAVTWVESEEAHRLRWAVGPAAVLAKFGLATAPPIAVSHVNDVTAVIRACQPVVAAWAGVEQGAVILVLNGGTKLTPVGLWQAFAPLRPAAVYGDDQPAVYNFYPDGLDVPPVIQPYTRHRLDLPDVLAATGHEMTEGERFWPGPRPEDDPYGTEPGYAANFHRVWHERNLAEACAATGRVPYAEMLKVVPPRRVQAWINTLIYAAQRNPREHLDHQVFLSVYQSALKLNEEARTAIQARNNPALPGERIGDAFERAVVRRVHAWLEGRRHAAVQSAWRNVKVITPARPEVMAEYDILIVLKNGVLWSLECKSHKAEKKDLDARQKNIQDVGSRLARLVVCAPLLTASADQAWFAAQHDFRAEFDAPGRSPFLAFTLPSQPEEYTTDGPDGPTSHGCPPMETALENHLRRYDPAPPNSVQ